MNPTVYLETTVVSYLAAWSSKDVIRQGHQEVTRRWWGERRSGFDLLTSQFVLDEAAAGDSTAAAERLALLNDVELLEITDEVAPLADRLLREGALPTKARLDALHLAVATVHRIDYLMTWNCKHLANALLWHRISKACRAAGFEPPTICTPLELLGDGA